MITLNYEYKIIYKFNTKYYFSVILKDINYK